MKTMSTNYIHIDTINNGNKDLTINVPAGTNVTDIVKAFMSDAEDVEAEDATITNNATMPLFKYIHYKITEESEQLKVHKMICNIVRLPKMQQVCDALVELMRQEQILSSIDQTAMLTELRRLGLPSDLKGFSDKNFYSFYRTK